MKNRLSSFELSQNRYARAQAMIVTKSAGGGSEDLTKVAILIGVEGSKSIEKSHGGRQQ